ncbi:MAG: hypothetical protein EOO77_41400 [Oxalobacteraceae bacterium]|nr:MAG: hypothetical protein EOO77_41400 [Oxalobacteraceae bacterium]
MRRDHDPSLAITYRSILSHLKAEFLNKEGECGVILIDEERDTHRRGARSCSGAVAFGEDALIRADSQRPLPIWDPDCAETRRWLMLRLECAG